NVLFYGNTATSTGGAVQSGVPTYGACTLTMTNVTIAQNTAPTAAALYSEQCCNVQQVTNTILYDNDTTGGGSDVVAVNSSSVAISYSLVEGVTFGSGVNDGGNNLTDEDPLFTDAAGGDFTVQAGSPAIDAGSNAALPADTTDLDGDTDVAEALPYALGGTERIFDGDEDTDAVVDIGDYEYGAPFVLPVELTSFTAVADGEAVVLRWETASETNNAGFEIQWVSNPEIRNPKSETLNWKTLAFVAGVGTTVEAQAYSYRADA